MVVRPPTIFVPACLRDHVVRLFEVYRAIAQSELNYNLVPLEVGEEYKLRTGLKVRAFRTCHVIPSQGYVIYSVKKKLKQECGGWSVLVVVEFKFKHSLVLTTCLMCYGFYAPSRIHTTSDFLDPDNADVLRAKILVVESTFLDDESHSVEHARKYGHTHLSEIASQSDKLGNKAILLFHFSARYTTEEIDAAINRLPPSFRSRVCALKEGFE
ncbi:hypothetical protein SETIT_1G011400v2 [Setaria italica]|uniref:Metallo-beta-lactamase domain-containing protein n=1 Tax=Setaria italica TaxID=4555 RepID=K3YZM0_SETIT|nr:hypothetical protein SETIT_1G011400v2 [Setaria italica]